MYVGQVFMHLSYHSGLVGLVSGKPYAPYIYVCGTSVYALIPHTHMWTLLNSSFFFFFPMYTWEKRKKSSAI